MAVGGGGGDRGVLSPVGDHILQEFDTLYQAWFRTRVFFETCFDSKQHQPKQFDSALLPENLRAYFELSAQAWILYKAP